MPERGSALIAPLGWVSGVTDMLEFTAMLQKRMHPSAAVSGITTTCARITDWIDWIRSQWPARVWKIPDKNGAIITCCLVEKNVRVSDGFRQFYKLLHLKTAVSYLYASCFTCRTIKLHFYLKHFCTVILAVWPGFKLRPDVLPTTSLTSRTQRPGVLFRLGYWSRFDVSLCFRWSWVIERMMRSITSSTSFIVKKFAYFWWWSQPILRQHSGQKVFFRRHGLL